MTIGGKKRKTLSHVVIWKDGKRLFSVDSHLCKCTHAFCHRSPSPFNILKALSLFVFSSKSYICFDRMGSGVWLVGCMNEHIKSCRLFYAKHLLQNCV